MRLALKISYFLLFSYCCTTYSTINFFIRPYPEDEKEFDHKKHLNNLITPGKTLAKTFKNNYLKNTSNLGLFGSYAGYLALSDMDGLMTFPRKQQKDAFKLLITPRIIPIFMIGNTIHHWQLDPLSQAQMYSIERIQDPATKDWLWQTKQIALPTNNIITLDTIVLFAKPQNIYVPEGITITNNNPQLVLPDIYAKKGLNVAAQALWVLTVRQFFGPLKSLVQKQSDVYYSQQLNIR
ncbi:MAG: hypothetical protein AB7R69_01870 [Candidatus Babeliales bacterium]